MLLRSIVHSLIVGLMALAFAACSALETTHVRPEAPDQILTHAESIAGHPVVTPLNIAPGDVWELWTSGTQLRGANIYQRRVYPQLDGPEFMGFGAIGPPYKQDDLDRLAAMGANYVNISHPGVLSEVAPYEVDPDVVANLDQLLRMIHEADMFAVISFRTGPGRSEFTFLLEDEGTWFDSSYLNDAVWTDAEAQSGWISMWSYTAERYRDNPIVVGYDLMVEPNANEAEVEIWDAEEFYDAYGGTLLDWNQLHPRIADAIREVDLHTPILVGGMSYSAIEWLPYLEPTNDPHTIYTFHQYAPHLYTHQEWSARMLPYPGNFDADWDGIDDAFNEAWLGDLLSVADHFKAEHGVPLAVNEFGVVRWVPGAAGFMDDQMSLFEAAGLNYALWVWEVSWEPFAEEVHAFNFRYGADPDNRSDLASSDMMDVIQAYWSLNTLRPSCFAVQP